MIIFESILTTFKASVIFLSNWGHVKNLHELKLTTRNFSLSKSVKRFVVSYVCCFFLCLIVCISTYEWNLQYRVIT